MHEVKISDKVYVRYNPQYTKIHLGTDKRDSQGFMLKLETFYELLGYMEEALKRAEEDKK